MSVVMNAGYWWACPTCQHENWCKAIQEVLSPEQVRAYLIEAGELNETDPMPDLVIQTSSYPAKVSCQCCAAKYDVLTPEEGSQCLT